MNLEEYLGRIENCPEKKGRNKNHLLTLEYGIYDNFAIFLNTNKETTINYFDNSSNYKRRNKSCNDQFLYVPGTVNLTVNGSNNENYNSVIHLHNYQGSFNVEKSWSGKILRKNIICPGMKMKKTSLEKAIALVVADIGKWAIKDKIPLYLPDSRGWNHLEDESRIVIYNPNS